MILITVIASYSIYHFVVGLFHLPCSLAPLFVAYQHLHFLKSSFAYLHHISLRHSFVDGVLGHFCILAIVNKACMSIVWRCWTECNLILIFLRNFYFPQWPCNLTFLPTVPSGSAFSSSLPILFLLKVSHSNE